MNFAAARPLRIKVTALAALIALAPMAARASGERHRVLIAPVEGAPAESDVRALLAQELSAAPRYELVPAAEATAALQPTGEACWQDEGCVAKVTHDVRADTILRALVAPDGKGYRLTVALASPGAVELARETETMRQLKSLPMNVHLCVTRLLEKDAARAVSVATAEAPPVTQAEPPPETVVAPPAEAPALDRGIRVAGSKQQRVLVLDLKGEAVEPAQAQELSGAIAQVIARHAGFDVASQDEVKQLLLLDKTRQQVGCESDSGCLTEISKKLNAELVVNGTIGRLGGSLVLGLALLDAQNPSATRRRSDNFESMEALRAGLDGSLGRLFGWSAGSVAQFHLPKGKASSFAVFDLVSSGVTVDIARNLTQVLSSEVKNVEGTSVISRDDIVALLQFDKQKADLGCTEDTACMASIGGALGVDRLVVGSVGRIGEDYVVALRLIDARHAAVENRHTESFRGSEDQLIGATRQAVRQLLGLEVTTPGKLAVTSSQPAADVLVDNEKRGKAPCPPIEALTPGRHTLKVSRDGFFDWQGDVYVNPFEVTSAWAQLKPRPLQWYQQWWVWTVAGVVVAGATTGILIATRSATSGGGVVELPVAGAH